MKTMVAAIVLTALMSGASWGQDAAGVAKPDAGDAAMTFTQAQVERSERVAKSLETAGYTEVQILDAAYLVMARNASGEQVVMYVGTPGASAEAATGGSAGETGAGTTGTEEGDAAKPAPQP